ncbi:DUF3472 domain-containing protein [Mucilaginibacter achroorhodeus]|uniref:DUF3472 domain-containing protein n=1 Tax=Mucilaginibacter achroorhodeus TaxID=2599294 RepID=A0A563TYG9_9SPHI|nr:DUF3472 domain-containing protein [Mucilaginibacter achroorhodeus]TWR24313.1 DUF3472 domain-containing protein [Mucilaginibacter achroorhodeus]
MKTRLFTSAFLISVILILNAFEVHAQSKDTTLPQNGSETQTENAAPSQHIFFDFSSDAVARIHKIKITRSADAEYFSVHNFRGGYDGLQQTPDKDFGTPNILIASLWDPNTAGKVLSRVSYAGPKTFTSRFGGEGDGWKTINPYKWRLNTWYNIAIRSWKSNGEFFVATFIQDMSTGSWFHTSTLAEADREGFLGKRDDAFLENWDGTNPAWDGRYIRKAFFKDCWALTTDNKWEKHNRRFFNANGNDKARNGKYDRSFDAGYDPKEDAYYMQHGGETKPNETFGDSRRLDLPEQAQQGEAPKLSVGAIAKLTASYAAKSIRVSWSTDNKTAPQFSSKVEILDNRGKILQKEEWLLPEKKSAAIKTALPKGRYKARLTVTDIFNQTGKPVVRLFSVL